jgi:ribonuclease G
VGKKGAGASLEDTITKINCEAAKEIVYQLRLRNIGGIIIIDFIDMDKGANREKVFKTLQEALAADRAKTNVLKISDIGLVEMTRKRVRESITRLTTEMCPTCDGRGHVRSKTTMAYDIMREVQRAAGKLLQGPEREAMRLLMMKLNKSITVRPQPQYHLEQYDLHAKWSRPELQQAQRGGRRDGGRRDGNRGAAQQRPEPARAPAEARPPEPPAAKVGD